MRCPYSLALSVRTHAEGICSPVPAQDPSWAPGHTSRQTRRPRTSFWRWFTLPACSHTVRVRTHYVFARIHVRTHTFGTLARGFVAAACLPYSSYTGTAASTVSELYVPEDSASGTVLNMWDLVLKDALGRVGHSAVQLLQDFYSQSLLDQIVPRTTEFKLLGASSQFAGSWYASTPSSSSS